MDIGGVATNELKRTRDHRDQDIMTVEHVDLHRLASVVTRLLEEAAKKNGSNSFRLEHNFYWLLRFEEQLARIIREGREFGGGCSVIS